MRIGYAGLSRHDGCPISGQRHQAEKNEAGIAAKLDRWSIQDIRRLVIKLAQPDQYRPHLRMVHIQMHSPSHSATGAPQIENATVVLRRLV